MRRFIGEIREYASITELDETILNRLIDKIIISAVEVIDGEKVQKEREMESIICIVEFVENQTRSYKKSQLECVKCILLLVKTNAPQVEE